MAPDDRSEINRRRFFARAAMLALGATTGGVTAATKPRRKPARTKKNGGGAGVTRAAEAYRRRLAAASMERDAARLPQPANGDRDLGPFAVYSKGLPHDPKSGVADAPALRFMIDAIESGRHDKLEAVPLGGYVKLADPQAAYAFDLIGPDAEQLVIAAPPSFRSAEQAGEMVELYWQALLRDVPFDEYTEHPMAASAAAELTRLDYRGPRDNGRVTPALLFRGSSRGGRIGGYVSQFFYRDLPWTPIRVPQKIRTALPKRDYATDEQHWLALQNGAIAEDTVFAEKPAYIRTARDLAEYVHRDFTYQAFLGACLMLFKMSAPVDGGIPYHYSISQSGFVTFGPSDILHLVAVVANVALKAAWYQKWRVHLRIRPEEFAGRIQKQRGAKFPLHIDVLNSSALDMIRSRFDTALLPQCYPEGAPTHPSYPAGHGVVAGACATVLKAVFAESFVIPNPFVPSPDGQTLRPYKGADLTIGHELDKLAENLAIARDFAGVHWRSDGMAGILLGEAVAINVLREMRMTSHEIFDGFELTKFDGSRVTVN